MRLRLLALAGLCLGACYKTPSPECAFACDVGASAVCPEGYTCRADGLCKREGVADNFACPDVDDAASIDMASIDMATIDAPDAAMVDAIDATVDAVDATVDALDADLRDASAAMLTITTTSPIDFGNQTVSTTMTRPVMVHNAGMMMSGAIAIDFSSPASQFAIVAGATDTCTGVMLAPGGDCAFEVSFTPDTADPFTASVRVSAAVSGSPQIVVMGTGN